MTVVFDLDDTLYRERDFVRSGLRHLARLHPGADLEGKWTEGMLREFREHLPDIQVAPGALETLSFLAGAGVTLGLVTDGRPVTQRNKIKALGIGGFFPPDMVLVSGETGHCKEDGTPFTTLMDRLPGETCWVYVGDNPAKDFLHPRRLGWLTVMVADPDGGNIHPQEPPTPLHSADVTVGSLAELPGLLRTLFDKQQQHTS